MKIGRVVMLMAISLSVGILVGRFSNRTDSSTAGPGENDGQKSVQKNPSMHSSPKNVRSDVSDLLDIADSARRVGGLLSYVESLEPHHIREALTMFVERIGREDHSPEQMTVFKELLSRYAESSPRKAIAFVKALMIPRTQHHGFKGVFTGWAMQNLDEATEYVSGISNDVSVMGLDFHQTAVEAVAKVVAQQKSGDEAIAWAKGLPASSAKIGFRHLAETIAATNPEDAARVAEVAPDGDSDWLASNVAYVWARQDPHAALAWIDSFAAPHENKKL